MYEIFEKLLKARGITIYKFCKDAGVSESTIYNWKKKKTQCIPKLQKIVCDFFGVTVDYLMTGESKEDNAGYYLNPETAVMAQAMFDDPDMRALFDMKRNMPPERFSAHVNFMKELYENEKKNHFDN